MTVFHLAIYNMAQRHVAFCERHVALHVRHVALHVRHVATIVTSYLIHPGHCHRHPRSLMSRIDTYDTLPENGLCT